MRNPLKASLVFRPFHSFTVDSLPISDGDLPLFVAPFDAEKKPGARNAAAADSLATEKTTPDKVGARTPPIACPHGSCEIAMARLPFLPRQLRVGLVGGALLLLLD